MGNPVDSILAWVLDKMPKIHYSKIESFLLLFQASQNYFMGNSMVLNTMIRDYFGDQNGQIAFDTFSQMVKQNLPPNQQLGGT